MVSSEVSKAKAKSTPLKSVHLKISNRYCDGVRYCGVPGPPCLSVLLMFLGIDEEICLGRNGPPNQSVFNIKGFMAVSGQRSGDGFYWRPCLSGMQQYVTISTRYLEVAICVIMRPPPQKPFPSYMALRCRSRGIGANSHKKDKLLQLKAWHEPLFLFLSSV